MRSVTISSVEKSYGMCHNVEFSICNHTFEWIIVEYMKGKTTDERIKEDTFDVMPVLPSFVGIDYNPYVACHSVMLLLSSSSESESEKTSSHNMLIEIMRVLTTSIVDDQREKVNLLTKSFRYSVIQRSMQSEHLAVAEVIKYIIVLLYLLMWCVMWMSLQVFVVSGYVGKFHKERCILSGLQQRPE